MYAGTPVFALNGSVRVYERAGTGACPYGTVPKGGLFFGEFLMASGDSLVRDALV